MLLLGVGFLFILDFSLPKPDLKTIIAFSLILTFTVGIIMAYTRFRVPEPTQASNPIIEEIIGEGIE